MKAMCVYVYVCAKRSFYKLINNLKLPNKYNAWKNSKLAKIAIEKKSDLMNMDNIIESFISKKNRINNSCIQQ